MMTHALAVVVVYGPVALLVAWVLVRMGQHRRRMREIERQRDWRYWAGDDNQRR